MNVRMAVGVRRFSTLAAVLGLAVVLVAAGSGRRNSVQPTLYFEYAMNCTFTIVNDAGQPVSSVPPGNYQVDVRTPLAFGTVPVANLGLTDMTACKGFPQFQLTGPGVNLSTTMTAGCSADLVFPETFQPNSTYIALDANQPGVTRTALTILGSGSPTVPQGPTGPGGGRASTSTDIVGSGIKTALRGTLLGTLTASGKPVLKSKGKPVSTLTAGRYRFTITDRDPKGSFIILGPKSASATNLTGVKFVGKRSATVRLTAGRWTYYAGLGHIRSFVVTG